MLKPISSKLTPLTRDNTVFMPFHRTLDGIPLRLPVLIFLQHFCLWLCDTD